MGKKTVADKAIELSVKYGVSEDKVGSLTNQEVEKLWVQVSENKKK